MQQLSETSSLENGILKYRASIEPNLHNTYLKFLYKISSNCLHKEVVKATYENCKVSGWINVYGLFCLDVGIGSWALSDAFLVGRFF